MLRDAVDSRFEFVRYGESLAGSQATFEPLAAALTAPPTLMDEKLQALTLVAIEKHQPTLVLLSVPFPGAVYAAFRIAQCIKQHHPRIHIAMGGGFVNTELRELTEPRVFDYVDFVTLDSGERPLLALLEHLEGNRSASRLVRTFIRKSADEPVSSDEDSTTWGDKFGGDTTDSPADVAQRRELVDAVSLELDHLPDRDRRIIDKRFGITSGEPQTLDAVADQEGVTRERIRQIEQKTLARLRHPNNSQRLRSYLESD